MIKYFKIVLRKIVLFDKSYRNPRIRIHRIRDTDDIIDIWIDRTLIIDDRQETHEYPILWIYINDE